MVLLQKKLNCLNLPNIFKSLLHPLGLRLLCLVGDPKSKHEFIVARYGLKSVDTEFLIPTIKELILALCHYGFIVNDIVGDGASENRSTFKLLATITAREILSKHFDATYLKDLPLHIKVAFEYPCKHLADQGVLVFIDGEMPHWAKKFRNALDNKKRNLTFRGKSFCLNNLYEVWVASGDGDVSNGCFVRKYKFGAEHFQLNSYNKMSVFLAVQIMSLTMTMIANLLLKVAKAMTSQSTHLQLNCSEL